jgi:hypothetical protein
MNPRRVSRRKGPWGKRPSIVEKQRLLDHLIEITAPYGNEKVFRQGLVSDLKIAEGCALFEECVEIWREIRRQRQGD